MPRGTCLRVFAEPGRPRGCSKGFHSNNLGVWRDGPSGSFLQRSQPALRRTAGSDQSLRAEKPNQYQKPVSPVPDPNGWFKARVVVDGQTVNVFVNDASIPTLTVAALGAVQRGAVGLWVGNGSGGDFANLKVTPKR